MAGGIIERALQPVARYFVNKLGKEIEEAARAQMKTKCAPPFP
jgi:hypothetical protein